MYKRPLVQAVFLFLVAFIPLAVPSDAMQIDEYAHWYPRTDRFLRAMQDGRFADTVQTEHPGITTVAFGGLGRMMLNQIDPARELPFITQMQWLRFPVNTVNALVIALAFLVAIRLIDPRVAFLGALMWATAPYMRWYMRLLHIDGMSTTFMLLSFALMLLAWRLHRSDSAAVTWWLVVLAGFVGGLATLTRFSSFYLAGMAGVLALINWYAYRHSITVPLFIRQIALPVIVFAGLIALTWTALYPGMWTNASAILGEFEHGMENALNPHNNGSYFMGQAVADPGFWYYPVAIPFRLTPWALLGLPLALMAAFSGAIGRNWRIWLAVTVYVGVYLGILVWQGKKFDRYALPAFPAMHLLAAFGWVWLAGKLAHWRAISGRFVWGAVIVLFIAHGLWYLRSEYAYVNPLLGGGGDHVEYALVMGSGEGMNDVVGYFRQELSEEDLCNIRVASFYHDMLERYEPCVHFSDMDEDEFNDKANYIVNYISYRQRFPKFQPRLNEMEPVHLVEVHGLTYAEIFKLTD